MIGEIIRIISIWSVVLPLVVGIINYDGLNNDSKWIFRLVVVAFIPQMLTFIIGHETPLLNISYNLYTPIEFGILYWIFIPKYTERVNGKIVLLSLWAYISICLYFFISESITKAFISSLASVNNIIYIVWILLLLKEQYQTETPIIQKRNPFAWYLLGLIIYVPTALILALYNYIRHEPNSELMSLWIIHGVCNILLYVFFAAGLFFRKKGAEHFVD